MVARFNKTAHSENSTCSNDTEARIIERQGFLSRRLDRHDQASTALQQ